MSKSRNKTAPAASTTSTLGAEDASAATAAVEPTVVDQAASASVPEGDAAKGGDTADKSTVAAGDTEDQAAADQGNDDAIKDAIEQFDAEFAPLEVQAAQFAGIPVDQVLDFRKLVDGRFVVVTRSGRKITQTPAEQAESARQAAAAATAKAAQKTAKAARR